MSSTTEANREFAVRFIQRMKECRGIDESLITEDFKWWGSRIGFVSAEQMRRGLKGMTAFMPELPTMTVLGSLADGDRVAVEVEGRCRLADGRSYDNHYVFLLEIRGGKVSLVKEFCDTKLAADRFENFAI